MNLHKPVACDALYQELPDTGFGVLFNDRMARPGVMVGDRGLDNGTVEYRGRGDSETQDIHADGLIE